MEAKTTQEQVRCDTESDASEELQALTRATYDRIAGAFAERVWNKGASLAPRIARFAEYLRRSAAPQDGPYHVLDAGCGLGRDSFYLQEQGFRVTGIDQSEGMLAEARRRVPPPAGFLTMDLRYLSFPDACFDGIWCNAALLHLPRREAPGVLARMRRLLRDDSVLFLNIKEGHGEAVTGRERDEPRLFT